MLKTFKLVSLILGLVSMTAVSASDTGMIVFETYPDGGIGVSNADGTNLRALAPRGGNPKWFPSGDKISFYVTDKRYSGTSPWMTGETRIVDITGALIKSVPYWVSDISADGKRLLVQKIYQSDGLVGAGGKSYEIGIYDISSDTYSAIVNPGNIPNSPEVGTPNFPKWMPDEKSIIFSFLGAVGERYFGKWSLLDMKLTLIEIPGGIEINCLSSGFDVSPDGNKIAFAGEPYHSQEKSKIYYFDMRERSVSLLHQEGRGRSAWYPLWSSDGSEVLYEYSIPDDVFGTESSFNVISINGKAVRPVFKKGIFHKLFNAVGGAVPGVMTNPDWWQPR